MSEPFSSQRWKLWQPDDLTLPASALTEALTVPEVMPEEADDTLKTLTLLQDQVRSEAQTAGYTEGYDKGLSEGQHAGYETGYQQGLSDAQQQNAPLQARMQQLVNGFQHSLGALDSVIATRLLQLALEAARQVIGQTPCTDSAALLCQIQSALQQEPIFSGKPQLRVHPEDLHNVEQSLGATLKLHGWGLLADSALHPGGCKVSNEDGELDASIDTRWHELCRLVPPGERS